MAGNVLLIRNVAPGLYGGGETYQLKLAEMLVASGFAVYIVTSSEKLLSEAKKRKIQTVRAPYFVRQNYSGWRNILLPVYYAKIAWLRGWYKRLFKECHPWVVNIQSRDDWIAASKVAKKMGIGVLWTDHMDFRSWVLTNVDLWYKNLIGKWVVRSARWVDQIIMISDYEREFFERMVQSGKCRNLITIKNGVMDELRKYDGVSARKKSFCYVGRVVDYKGIGELLEAFSAVLQKYPDAFLNIYGDGELDYYKRIAGNNVKFWGRTDAPLKAIAENEIFVLPSYREGLSLSLLDAAMMQKKIIASDVGGNPEVIRDKEDGILVPAKDVKKLADAMIWMLKNEGKAGEMAKNARKKYEKNFDLDKIFAEKMLPLYNVRKER